VKSVSAVSESDSGFCFLFKGGGADPGYDDQSGIYFRIMPNVYPLVHNCLFLSTVPKHLHI